MQKIWLIDNPKFIDYLQPYFFYTKRYLQAQKKINTNKLWHLQEQI